MSQTSDYIVTNATANVWYDAPAAQWVVLNAGTSATYECRSFNSSGVQTVYGSLAAGVRNQTTSTTDRSGYTGGFGVQKISSLANNGSDVAGPEGSSNTTLTGGAYLAIRVFAYTGRPYLQAYVRRSGAWSVATDIDIRRSGAWVSRSEIDTRRSSAWNQLG